MSPAMINAAGEPMEETLTALFNVCWDEGKLPERWGKARVRMLYKMGKKSDVGNSRRQDLDKRPTFGPKKIWPPKR